MRHAADAENPDIKKAVAAALTLPDDLEKRLVRQQAFWQPGFAGEGAYCVVRAPRAGWERLAGPEPRSLYARWLDVDYRVRRIEHDLASTYLGGDGVPIAIPNLGPGVLPGLMGHPFALSEQSIWFDQNPFDDPASLFELEFRADAEFSRAYAELNERLLERACGRYYVAMSDFGSCFDTLAAFFRREDLLAEVVLDPERVTGWIKHLLGFWEGALRENRALIGKQQRLQANWIPLLNERDWYALISEVSSMISAESFEQISLPALRREAAGFEQVLFNLDGDTAARHVDAICQIPQLHAVFWSPTIKYTGGKAFYQDLLAPESIAVCRRIQQRVKLLIDGIKSWQVKDFVRQISPDGLFLMVDCENQTEAEETLRGLRRWMR
jgi:hypothetical protein